MAKIVDEIMMALKRQTNINRVIVGKREYIAIGKEIDDLRHFPFRPSTSDILLSHISIHGRSIVMKDEA